MKDTEKNRFGQDETRGNTAWVKQFEEHVKEVAKKCQEEAEARARGEFIEEEGCSLGEVFAGYRGLGWAVHQKLAGILNNGGVAVATPEELVALGERASQVVALGDAIVADYEYYESLKAVEALSKVFRYWLNRLEVTNEDVVVNEPIQYFTYDEREQMRTPGSLEKGSIDLVVLPGFSIGNEVRRKPLVVVAYQPWM